MHMPCERSEPDGVVDEWQPPSTSNASKKKRDGSEIVKTTFGGRVCFQKWTTNPIEYYPDRPRRDGFKLMGPKNRLRNEIAALQFLGSHPKIPTPELLFHSVTSKHVCLVTDAIDGVHVRDLQDVEDFRSACAEIDEIKERLGDIVRQNAGSFIGDVFFNEVMSCTLNKRKVKIFDDDTSHGYPLCHGDLYASNIIVDPMSGRVKALIDWEYAGYFPAILDPPCFLTERKDVGQAALQAYKDGLAAFCSAYRQAHIE